MAIDIDKLTLNLTQLNCVVRNNIADHREVLAGEIRTVGLREKMVVGLQKMIEIKNIIER